MIRRLAITLAALTLTTLTLSVSAMAGVQPNEAEDDYPQAKLLVPADPSWNLWPTNEQGQTYGTPQETSAGYHEPDLMKVVATNGVVGYAFSSDLTGPEPSSPEEAVAWQIAQGDEPRMIPVYESDGVTQIGVFKIGGR